VTQRPTYPNLRIKEGNDELFKSLSQVLADTFALYLKAHNFHWNVVGPNFPQYHDFFGDLYEELHGAVDPIAEQIRAIGYFVPGTLQKFAQMSVISAKDPADGYTCEDMFKELLDDNDRVSSSITQAYIIAERCGEIGLSNFLQDRADIHKKHRWQIKATANMR
jgi:starvation-inducible DNA-binding protein